MQKYIVVLYCGHVEQNAEKVLERVETWPEERQEDAANVLIEMEQQDAYSIGLTDPRCERSNAASPNRTRNLSRSRSAQASHIPSLMKVVIEEEALDDLDGIRAWIASDDPASAARRSKSSTRSTVSEDFPLSATTAGRATPLNGS